MSIKEKQDSVSVVTPVLLYDVLRLCCLKIFIGSKIRFYLFTFLPLLQSSCFEQSRSIRLLHASEVGKHFEQILGIAAAENLGAESLTNSRVECTMLSKVVGYVDSENLCPQIAVIACCIATSPYVVKVSGRVSWRYLSIENSCLEESFFLEGSSHVGRRNLFGSQLVPSQVETGGS